MFPLDGLILSDYPAARVRGAVACDAKMCGIATDLAGLVQLPTLCAPWIRKCDRDTLSSKGTYVFVVVLWAHFLVSCLCLLASGNGLFPPV